MEFRCTRPVKPTAIQKPLYGASLESHIGVELCGKPLLAFSKRKPDIVFVQIKYMLDVRPSLDCPVVWLRRAGEAIDIQASGEGTEESPSAQINPVKVQFQPVLMACHPDYEEKDRAQEMLQQISLMLDPLEPFERVQAALDLLRQNDEKFQ